jgi:HTH-type transcriptional regulator / antitoxin HigA
MKAIIKSEAEYTESLAEVERLLEGNPSPGTPKNEELELLTLLIQDYESRSCRFDQLDPIEAIKFRMEQQNLTPRDLIPYIGSRSKVSEVLSGKRPLTISMIRALHSGLRIPADVLILGRGKEGDSEEIEWERFPLRQMIDWGWVNAPEAGIPIRPEEILRPLITGIGSLRPEVVLCRASSHVRSARAMDDYSLIAWAVRVLDLASKNPVTVKYKPKTLTMEFLREVSHYSTSDTGPLLIKDFLRKHGIQIIIERHLPRTYLDGAAIIADKSKPVIGLTIRYDRIDSFWFTLMHELAHLALHLDTENNIYFDDLDVEGEDDIREREANRLAGEALIPEQAWEKSPASRLRSPVAAEHLAKELSIHPAIVAGRMQHEFKVYQLLGNLVGHRKVRKLFPEVKW